MVIDTVESPRDLFEYELQVLYHMEHEIVGLHENLTNEAESEELQDLFSAHEEESRDQIERIEQVFKAIDAEPEQRSSPLMEGLLDEQQRQFGDIRNAEVANVAVIEFGSINERIEISTLDALLSLADDLDMGEDVTTPLQTNKEEAGDTLETLKSMV